MQTTLEDKLAVAARGAGFSIADVRQLDARSARFAPIPAALNPDVASALRSQYPKGLYKHQSAALELALKGKDICLATSTASGKSLVFMTHALNVLLSIPTANVIALYPAKALIQDQLNKWRRALEPFDMRSSYVDGAVPMDTRERVLDENRVVLMTPDVAHAWLMSKAGKASLRRFMESTHLLILDEAHVYDGVFGSNMAYFVRRLIAASGVQQVVTSTATMGEPALYVERLAGRACVELTEGDDGSPRPPKTVMLLGTGNDKAFDATVALLREITSLDAGRFIAFADSRKQVELLVATLERGTAPQSDDDDGVDDSPTSDRPKVLPYRSGYEEEDRKNIQKSLTEGSLAGVVSTSALELGLDIGEIDVVVLLGAPPTMKSLWQRIGRAGRRNPAVCLIIDSRGSVQAFGGGLREYLLRPLEPGWLYLENRYLQYSQALCAAHEITGIGEARYRRDALASLPSRFQTFLDNELNPVEAVAEDLYPLKQRGQETPHFEFPVRTGIDKSFLVKERSGPASRQLGTLTHSQLSREGYPGAIYYYMARPYRISQVNFRTGEVLVRRTKRWTTQPNLQTMVFPRFNAYLAGRKSSSGFVVEAPVQVSERVIGFIERRGPNKSGHLYGPGSIYSERPVTRSLETTGVCWVFDDTRTIGLAVGETILEAFSVLCGIEKREIGVGSFRAKSSSLRDGDCQGICVYDATYGSLRLTQQLADRFEEVCELAIRLLENAKARDIALSQAIESLRDLARATEMLESRGDQIQIVADEASDDIVRVIARGQTALLLDEVTREVTVVDFRYTPKGALYELKSDRDGNSWMVPRDRVVAIPGETLIDELNLITGERKSLGPSN